MKDLVLNSNVVMKNLMKLIILSIFVTVFIQVEVVSFPLLRDAALHGQYLENSYLCSLAKQFL